MTTQREPETLLSAYLAEGMEVLPDRVVESVLAEVHRTRQRAAGRPQLAGSMPRPSLAAAAVVAMLALVGVVLVVGGGPSPTPSEPPIPSQQGIVAPSSTPDDPSAAPTASPITDPAGVWIPTGSMLTPRYDQSAVRLLDGRVLVMGGSSGRDSSGEYQLTSAEVYDPLTGTWTATEDMIGPNLAFPPTLLRDGRVMVGFELDEGAVGAHLYDPHSGTWSAAGQMVRDANFVGDTATLLPDGRVLVAGLNGAQVYDPASGTWSNTGAMPRPRYMAAAALLPDGTVLVAGGHIVPDIESRGADVFDPNTGSWSEVADALEADGHRTATPLPDGRVLVAGTIGMEIYDPVGGTWTAVPVPGNSRYHSATLLADGRLLMTHDELEPVGSELYDPGTGFWRPAAPMLRAHGTPAIRLLDGTVLVAGGIDCLDEVCAATGSAELYIPAGVSPPPLPTFPTPPPPVIPPPTPRPTPYPPQVGPEPDGGRAWTVTVTNDSAEPVTLLMAEDGERGMGPLCGSMTPNVVPARASESVTFLLPPKDVIGCAIWVNPVPGEGGSLVATSDAPLPGKIWITADGQIGWLRP